MFDVEVANRHPVVGPGKGLCDQGVDLLIPCRDRIVHTGLDPVAVMGELQASVLDRAVPRDKKLHSSALWIRMEREAVRLKMVDQHLEWRDCPAGGSFFGQAQYFR